MNLHYPDSWHLVAFRCFDAYRMPHPLEEERILPHLEVGATFTTRELAEKTRIRPEELFKLLCWYWVQKRLRFNLDDTGRPVSWTVER